MTTKQNDKLNTKTTDVRSFNPPSLFNIQYPNSRTGMFSLRTPFKNSYINEYQPQQQIYARNVTPNVVHPKYLHMDRNQQERSYDYPPLKQDAQVQCSLINSNNREEVLVQNAYLTPRYPVQLQLQPTQPNIYEVWEVDTPPPRSIPINEPIRRRERSIHIRSPRLINIKSFSDDESDYDDYLLCTHPCSTPYFPAPVRMIRVRQDANTICY